MSQRSQHLEFADSTSTGTEMSFELLDSTIWELFEFECPGERQNIGNVICTGNNGPSFDYFEGLNFNLRGFPVVFSIGTIHSLPPGGVVFLSGCGLCCKNHG